ncbi:MAG: METTL5 family protein [Halanaeroarchaeum sp.]
MTMRKRDLERRLSAVSGFSNPILEHEQYVTPSPIAAHLVHLAALHGDLDGPVVDLGTGTGVLAIATSLAGAGRVLGVELDDAALDVARENETTIDPPTPIDWVRGDATRAPVCTTEATVVMNPPFGAHRGNRHADRAFLAATVDLASVSYSVHNAGSEAFVESFAADNGGEVTHAFRADVSLPKDYDHQSEAERTISTEVFRIEWADYS